MSFDLHWELFKNISLWFNSENNKQFIITSVFILFLSSWMLMQKRGIFFGLILWQCCSLWSFTIPCANLLLLELFLVFEYLFWCAVLVWVWFAFYLFGLFGLFDLIFVFLVFMLIFFILLCRSIDLALTLSRLMLGFLIFFGSLLVIRLHVEHFLL